MHKFEFKTNMSSGLLINQMLILKINQTQSKSNHVLKHTKKNCTQEKKHIFFYSKMNSIDHIFLYIILNKETRFLKKKTHPTLILTKEGFRFFFNFLCAI